MLLFGVSPYAEEPFFARLVRVAKIGITIILATEHAAVFNRPVDDCGSLQFVNGIHVVPYIRPDINWFFNFNSLPVASKQPFKRRAAYTGSCGIFWRLGSA